MPLNVGSEPHDFVKLVDTRQNENSFGNIWQQEILVSEGVWVLNFSFGDARQGAFEGLDEVEPIAFEVDERLWQQILQYIPVLPGREPKTQEDLDMLLTSYDLLRSIERDFLLKATERRLSEWYAEQGLPDLSGIFDAEET